MLVIFNWHITNVLTNTVMLFVWVMGVLCIMCKASATGEVTLAPDICMFNIVVSSQKDRLQDAKNSVTRRLDYILQTLRNRRLKVFMHSL